MHVIFDIVHLILPEMELDGVWFKHRQTPPKIRGIRWIVFEKLQKENVTVLHER